MGMWPRFDYYDSLGGLKKLCIDLRERGGKTHISLLFHLFKYSLVDTSICPDQGSTCNLGISGPLVGIIALYEAELVGTVKSTRELSESSRWESLCSRLLYF